MHVNERHNNNNNYNKPHQYLRTSKDCNLLDLQRTFKGMHRSSEGINNYYINIIIIVITNNYKQQQQEFSEPCRNHGRKVKGVFEKPLFLLVVKYFTDELGFWVLCWSLRFTKWLLLWLML